MREKPLRPHVRVALLLIGIVLAAFGLQVIYALVVFVRLARSHGQVFVGVGMDLKTLIYLAIFAILGILGVGLIVIELRKERPHS